MVLLALAIFYIGALLTYPGLDPSGEILGDNAMGPVGNGVARWTLAAVGLSVYPLALVLILTGLRLLLGRGVLRVGAPLLLACVSWAVSLAVIFHVSFQGTTVHGDHLAGGAVGELMGEVLCSLFSTAGTYLVASVVVLVTAVLATNLSVAAQLRLLIRAFRWIGRLAVSLLDRLGAVVIRTAEKMERNDEPPEAKVHRDDDDEPSPAESAEPAAPAGETHGPSPRVQQQKKKKRKKQDDDELEIEIRPLPDQEGWDLPPLSLLDEIGDEEATFDERELQTKANQLTEALADYGVSGQVTDIHPGPVVTLYEYVPKSGTKLSKISGLRDELAMRLEVERVRIVAPIPGKNAVGFEVPNADRVVVGLKSVLANVLSASRKGKKKMTLPLALGQDIGGLPFGVDLARMPHLIVAGTTGSGKSVCVNALLLSLLYRFTPQDLRLIMIDPKEVELGGYDDIPHLLVPVVTDMNKAASALCWAVDEMERRYALFADSGAKNIESYNKRVRALPPPPPPAPPAEGEEAPAEDEEPPARPEPLPFVVIVLDELADLMMVAAREVETAIARLAQKARAAGIHLVVATQRPSTDVMSGTIRNNFPARISFRVATGTDSRTVLDSMGAESLLGAGDMLVRPPGTSDLVRVHGAYVSEEEVERVVAHLRRQGQPTYEEAVFQAGEDDGPGADDEEMDPKTAEQYDQAVALVAEKQKASVSMIQRHLRIGYNTAARLMERMEREGVVGPERGSRPREVLISPTEPA